MVEDDLHYDSLVKLIEPFAMEGRTESAAFLRWFLGNIFRLDDTDADDAICDSKNDKGVDGVYVNNLNEQIFIFQSKISQKVERSLGDKDLKEFMGTLGQFSSSETVDALVSGTGNPRLKQLVSRNNISSLITDGYKIRGCFVTNMRRDKNAEEFLGTSDSIELYDAPIISFEYIDLEADSGVKGTCFIPAFEGQIITYKAGDQATLYQFIAEAGDLVKLGGIDDQSLFAQNVRLSLGDTKVNKDIATSIGEKSSHKRFPLFHNGITLLANKIDAKDGGVSVQDYVVVNGAQSLSTLYNNKDSLTEELRIAVRAVELIHKPDLAKEITHNSNNQNAIKARDLKANHSIQLRLQTEMSKYYAEDYAFSIKRGEPLTADSVISNEDAAALMLAMDLQEPWSCHQRYKFFDDFYAPIFGRPEVSPERIIFLYEIGEYVRERMGEISYKPISRYKLSYFFILYCLSQIMTLDEKSKEIFLDPSEVFNADGYNEAIQKSVAEIVSDIITDFNYEIKQNPFIPFTHPLTSAAPSMARAIDEF